MSRELLVQNVNNHTEFSARSTPRIEKIFMHVMEADNPHFELNEADQQYYDKLKSTFSIISKEWQDRKAIKIIGKELNVSRPTAIKLMNDAEDLFGRVREVNRKFLKYAARERLKKLIDKMEKKGKWDLVVKLNIELNKLDDLYKDEKEVFDPTSFKIPAPVFTTDIRAINEGATIVYDEAEIINDEEE